MARRRGWAPLPAVPIRAGVVRAGLAVAGPGVADVPAWLPLHNAPGVTVSLRAGAVVAVRRGLCLAVVRFAAGFFVGAFVVVLAAIGRGAVVGTVVGALVLGLTAEVATTFDGSARPSWSSPH